MSHEFSRPERTTKRPRLTNSQQPIEKVRVMKMLDLPPEIIATILARLPVKCILRFRCVSKPCLSLIDGQDFTKLHLRHSAETNIDRTLIVQSVCRLLKFNLDSLKELDTGNIGITNSAYARGSCNGLILLASTNKIYLWNPSTRKLNVLPALEAAGSWTGRCGLGYDSKHDDYKVVCMDRRLLWIYSLKTNSWKRVDFPYDLTRSRCVCVNDALHFVVVSTGSGSGSGAEEEIIMAFDLAKEEYKEVPKPESADGCVICRLASDGVRLVVVVDRREEAWVMNEHGVKGSWCKLTNSFDGVRMLGKASSSDRPHEVALLFEYQGTRLFWAHVEGSIRDIDVEALGSPFDAWVCVASLVSPFSPVRIKMW